MRDLTGLLQEAGLRCWPTMLAYEDGRRFRLTMRERFYLACNAIIGIEMGMFVCIYIPAVPHYRFDVVRGVTIPGT